ncbi:MAG: trypsin-like peptidase domain-containing protein [Flavisolibacter sp.]
MFKTAIEKVGNFTRPVHFISNVYGEQTVRPGAATLFFVNDEGMALTCKHVTSLIKTSVELISRYQNFLAEKNGLPKSGSFPKKMKELKAKYGYDKPDNACQLLYQLVDCTDLSSIDVFEHPVYDLALIKMKGFTKKFYSGHAVFAKDSSLLQPGVFLCRLGFPFPEFTNFSYDVATETISWTQDPTRMVRFPIEGMVTRHFGDPDGKISGVEMSTPGLKGQSGGPLFNSEGLVFGMQSRTHHLHLGFDMNNHEIFSEGRKIKITNQPLLHVGHCVHVDIMKAFLREHGVPFFEE